MNAHADLDKYFWEDLLDFIEEARIVPIIGPELLTVSRGQERAPLQRVVAELLAERLRLPPAELPPHFSLDDVVSRYVQDRRRHKEDLYPRLHQVMRELAPTPPQPLLDLAAITPFNLFVTVTFDSLLIDAINATRFGGTAGAQAIAFTPNVLGDLPAPMKQLARPVVFHMLGKLSTAPEYVICDEDLLEYLHALQEDSRRPKLLFDELRENHLLILGCGLSDWLARFFLRTAKSRPLSLNRAETEIVVDGTATSDPGLVMFLENFSYGTRLIPGAPAAFAADLRQRWEARHPPEAGVVLGQPRETRPTAAGAVFLSYAHEDIEVVRRLADALRSANIDVWVDKVELRPGVDWERAIRLSIENSALFVPVISRATQQRRRGAYFWREWDIAADCAGHMAPGETFLIPVVVDGIPPYTGDVPDRFRRVQWTALPEGRVPAEFVEHVRDVYRQFHARQKIG